MKKQPSRLWVQALYPLFTAIELMVLLMVLVPIYDRTVFILLLCIIFSFILRWRLPISPVYMLVDEAIFIILTFYMPVGIYFLGIFVYYFTYKRKPFYAIPAIIVGLFQMGNPIFMLYILQAGLVGMILDVVERKWIHDKVEQDVLRSRIYELESIQAQLLADYRDTERISRLTERQRISEILHDHLGHELTAAHLSLKAHRALLGMKQMEQADRSLSMAEERLEQALEQLKISVKRLEPKDEFGLSCLEEMLNRFSYTVDFRHTGDVLKLKPYIWQLLYMCVKEALTNIIKHAKPMKVTVDLEVTDYIVRLNIVNDGVKVGGQAQPGNGLRYMRKRLEAINGSLSIHQGNDFSLIIIIPIQ